MESKHKIVSGWWEVLEEFVSDGVPVRKFRSQKSGLTLSMAEIEGSASPFFLLLLVLRGWIQRLLNAVLNAGPLVNGYFALPTEAHDNFGYA